METTIPTLKQQIDALLDTFSDDQLRQVLDFARSVSSAAGGNPYAIDPKVLIEWANSLSPEAREAQREVTQILEEAHEREMRRLEAEE